MADHTTVGQTSEGSEPAAADIQSGGPHPSIPQPSTSEAVVTRIDNLELTDGARGQCIYGPDKQC